MVSLERKLLTLLAVPAAALVLATAACAPFDAPQAPQHQRYGHAVVRPVRVKCNPPGRAESIAELPAEQAVEQPVAAFPPPYASDALDKEQYGGYAQLFSAESADRIRMLKARFSQYEPLFMHAGSESTMPYTLLAAQAAHESSFNPTTVSDSGAVGMMQVLPSSASAWGWDPAQLTNPGYIVPRAAQKMAELHAQFGNWETALLIWHSGETNVRRGTIGTFGKAYVPQVFAMQTALFPHLPTIPSVALPPVSRNRYGEFTFYRSFTGIIPPYSQDNNSVNLDMYVLSARDHDTPEAIEQRFLVARYPPLRRADIQVHIKPDADTFRQGAQVTVVAAYD